MPIKGDAPKRRIIGSDYKKEEELNELPQIEKVDHKWDKYIEYNKEINVHPEYISKFTPKDNHVLIRCFKYESDETTEGGLILGNDYEWVKTDGGQMKMRTSTNPYQKRAIIVKSGYLPGDNEFYAKLIPNTIVVLSTNKLDSGKFDTEPSKKGSKDLGYFLVHVGLINGIENA